ncbi:unnamed protein product, partial [Rotaria sp. Silwood1]
MENWTVDRVSQWLNKNGFEKCIPRFKDENIDGEALMKVNDDQLENLLSVLNQDGIAKKPTQRTKRIFKAELE